jgi:hypothetical protein
VRSPPHPRIKLISDFIIMYFIWRNWRTMVSLRSRWFRSPAYQHKIYSRTLMVTQIRKDYRSDAGLLALMGQLKVDGIKIGPEIDCTSIGELTTSPEAELTFRTSPRKLSRNGRETQRMRRGTRGPLGQIPQGKQARQEPTYSERRQYVGYRR